MRARRARLLLAVRQECVEKRELAVVEMSLVCQRERPGRSAGACEPCGGCAVVMGVVYTDVSRGSFTG